MLREEPSIAQTVKHLAGCAVFASNELSDPLVGQGFPSGGMDQRDAVGTAKGATSFEFVDPCPFGGRDGA